MATFRRYQPSWVNLVLDWINGLPIHPALFYILFYLASVLLVHIALWADGSAGWGEWVSPVFFDMAWVPYALGYLNLMERTAARSLEEFRPVLALKKNDFEAVKYHFLTMPFWPVLLLSVAGFIFGVWLVYRGHSMAASQFSQALWALLSGPGYTFTPVWIYAAWRHVSQISQLYRQVGEFNLFDLQPFYGLARVTMLIGAFSVITASMNYIWEVLLGTPSMTPETALLVSFFALVIGVVVTVVPLWGIHQKIENNKQQLLTHNARQIEELHQNLQADLAKKKLGNLEKLEKGLHALFTMRTNIRDVPAWPWRPGAFRNFASAILLPVLLLILERVVSQFF